MSRPPIYLSASPGSLREAVTLADGVEVKLDWEHADDLLTGRTLTERCRGRGVDPGSIVSVHLPPGTDRRYGMTAAPGNVGKIADFTHTALGSEVVPEWLTVHSPRRFEYRDHVERLGTITDVTGYPIAVENTPDASYFHAPEELALMALLAEHVDRLADTYLLVDTAHVDSDRREPALDESVIDDVLGRMDPELANRLEDGFLEFVTGNVAELDENLPPDDPWRPVQTNLFAVGGDRVRAVHLNDPVEDGLPSVGRDGSRGLDTVLRYCRRHGVAIVLEPGSATNAEIEEVVRWLRRNG